MASAQTSEVPFKLGSEVHLLPKGYPNGLRGEVIGLDPIQIETSKRDVLHLVPGQETPIVFQESNRLWRMKSTIKSVSFDQERGQCELEATKIWEIDQRQWPRYPVDVPVEIGCVTEFQGEPVYQVVHGTAVNMSLTGARVRTDSLIPAGTIFHLTFRADPVVTIKSLAITAGCEQEESYVGLSFIEFLDDGQLDFHEFLGHLAA